MNPSSRSLLWLLLTALSVHPWADGLKFEGGKLPLRSEWVVNELNSAQQVLLLNVEKRPQERVAGNTTLRRPPSPLSNLLVLYFSRHFGTVQDFGYVARSLGLNWAHLTADQTCYDYYSGVEKAEECYEKIKYICDVFDVIFIADINPDGFPLLKYGCRSWIVFQMTNRFDWDVRDKDMYYKVLNESSQNNPRVLFMGNNPMEVAYAHSVGVHIPINKYYLARPTGYSPLPGGCTTAYAVNTAPPCCQQQLLLRQ